MMTYSLTKPLSEKNNYRYTQKALRILNQNDI
jgi:hypothetical protein